MLQLAGHLRNIFGGKLQQRFVSQTRVNANPVEMRIGKITQHALRQRQFAVHLISGLLALFAFHHFCPDALEIGGICCHLLLMNAFRRGTDNESALLVTVFRDHFFQAFTFRFAFNTLRDADVRSAGHKDQIARGNGDIGGQAGAFGAEGIFHHLHH